MRTRPFSVGWRELSLVGKSQTIADFKSFIRQFGDNKYLNPQFSSYDLITRTL